ncbi:MAG TPA: glycoside hydrolase domain-containing protein [Gemmatimonadaceae bacterium]|nr:glycoside hydrolase domain-containing protein [Gemmatimonadaceae bacterium]
MNQSRERRVRRQWVLARGLTLAVTFAFAVGACTESPITETPTPNPGGGINHPGFDTSLYPGDAAMSAWLKPSSPYEWVGYYLQAPCHRDPSWMGKRTTLTAMRWGLAVLFVGQQTFDGVPDVVIPPVFNRVSPTGLDSLPRARAGVVTPPTLAELQSGVVTCSRTLLTTEQGATDAIDAVTKTASEGFPAATVIYLDIEHMDSIPASMDAYYRAWVQQVLADGRFRPGIYVHKANAAAIYDGVRRAYADMNQTGSAIFWVTTSSGFSISKNPQDVGFPWASIWQGMYDVTQTWNGAAINIDVDVAAMASPSSPP